MVELKPMSKQRFAIWSERIWQLYEQELIDSGISPTKAKQQCESGREASMPNGVLQPGNEVFESFHNNESVGIVWLWRDETEWFIYDIDIDEQHRGKGLGRSTMQAIEAHVKQQGGTAIGLSVFGFNEIARKLYESEGYETKRIQMKKQL